MSWSPKRRDSETLATAWTLRLSTCMASKIHYYTHTHIIQVPDKTFSLNSISVVSVSDFTSTSTQTHTTFPLYTKTNYSTTNTVHLINTKFVTLDSLNTFYYYLFHFFFFLHCIVLYSLPIF